MCDTLYVRHHGVGWFAKNSDREPDEPQALVWRGAAEGDAAATLRCTYIDVPQVPRRHGVLLSQPSWIWGGEIGVNDQGVAIGNEAVFSKLVDKKGQSLLGMDLLRLGLERAATAREALDVITGLLAGTRAGRTGGLPRQGFPLRQQFHHCRRKRSLGARNRRAPVGGQAGAGLGHLQLLFTRAKTSTSAAPGLQDETHKLGLVGRPGTVSLRQGIRYEACTPGSVAPTAAVRSMPRRWRAGWCRRGRRWHRTFARPRATWRRLCQPRQPPSLPARGQLLAPVTDYGLTDRPAGGGQGTPGGGHGHFFALSVIVRAHGAGC